MISDFGDRRSIFVIGYPRSGTTWLARALAEAIGCPSLSWRKDILPKADPVIEGLERRSPFVVQRSHFSTSYFDDHKEELDCVGIVHIVRDPRDITVSCWYHFTFDKTRSGLDRCARQLCGLELGPPLIADSWGGRSRYGWPGFVEEWLEREVITVRYEDLLTNCAAELLRVLSYLDLSRPDDEVRRIAEAHRFDRRPKDRLMRKGVAGTWKEELSEVLVWMICYYCGDIMARLGYEAGARWNLRS